MGKLTELRGALGGGIASISWSNGAAPNHVLGKRVRVVQAKRQVNFYSDWKELDAKLMINR